MTEPQRCWCNAGAFQPYSEHYVHCKACGTLVARDHPAEDLADVEDAGELYSKEYYLRHLPEDYGLPSLEERARNDLPERNLFWLKTLLSHRLPPARILELGSAHGSFVALMRWAGFEATGLELSPWLAQYASETFAVPMLVGPIEKQTIEPESLDALVLMDVLEHLQDPVRTIQRALDGVKPDGIIMIQTPRYLEEKSHAELVAENDRFLEQLKEQEHLFLYSERAIEDLLRRLGLKHIKFEPAIFSDYDMFVLASRHPFRGIDKSEGQEQLATTPSGRMVLAMLDLDDQLAELTSRLATAEDDRAARLAIIQSQGRQLGKLQETLDRQSAELSELWGHYRMSEAERALLGQQRNELIQEQRSFISGLSSSRAYRLLRALGRWEWIDQELKSIERIMDRGLEEQSPPGQFIELSTSGSSLSDFRREITEFNRSQPNQELLDGIRSYNHSILDQFNDSRSLRGHLLLDVGASPHGYALERALDLGVAAYFGIGLDVKNTISVYGQQGNIGQLIKMDATDIRFPDNVFDSVVSISTLEHIAEPGTALEEIERVLKPGGQLLIAFEPIWSSASGHHLHHFGECAELIPAWAHLLWDPSQMRSELLSKWPEDAPLSLEEAIDWVYASKAINRRTVVDYLLLLDGSGLVQKWIVQERESAADRAALAEASRVTGLSEEQLQVRGLSALLEKPGAMSREAKSAGSEPR